MTDREATTERERKRDTQREGGMGEGQCVSTCPTEKLHVFRLEVRCLLRQVGH